jgi:hypothetical protein
VTLYLLDENVLRELHSRGNVNVRRWIAKVDDTDLRLSAATLRSVAAPKRSNGVTLTDRKSSSAPSMRSKGHLPIASFRSTPPSLPSGRACWVRRARIAGIWRWRQLLASMILSWSREISRTSPDAGSVYLIPSTIRHMRRMSLFRLFEPLLRSTDEDRSCPSAVAPPPASWSDARPFGAPAAARYRCAGDGCGRRRRSRHASCDGCA